MGRSCMKQIFLSLLLLIVAAQSYSDEPKPITVEDMWAVKRIGAPSISPDGKWVAADVTGYDMKENNSASDVWLFPVNRSSGEARQLTAHTARDGGAQYSPDGKWILFLSKREGDDASQIYVISTSGGEAKRVTKITTGAGSPKWFPDSKRIAFISWVWPDLKSDEEQGKRLKERKEAKVKAYIIDTTHFRQWDHWLADGRKAHLFTTDISGNETRDLFAGKEYGLIPYENSADLSTDHYDISPDGNELAFVMDSTPDPGFNPNADVFVISSQGGEAKSITEENKASDSNPKYSPDGKWIAYTKQEVERFFADLDRVALFDRSTKAKKVLTEKWDRSAGPLTWSPDSKHLYFLGEDQARVHLWKLNLNESTPKLVVRGGTLGGFDISSDGKTIAFTRTTMSLPAALYASSADGKKEQKLDAMNDDLVKKWKLGEVKEMTFQGWNNEPVQMWVVLPPDFYPKKKWPLLHMVHGGPHSAVLDQFHYRWNLHLMASRGHLVAAVNFHGSSGWGFDFTDSITGQYGKKELEDVEKGTDTLLQTGYIDPERLSAAGGSFGGFMMAWMNGHTTRYKTFICHAGVYDYTAQMASDMIAGRDRALGGFHWENPEKVEAQSARNYAKNFKTPTLIIHGEKDYRVPVTQGLAYYNTLRMMKIPTRLIYFEEENHWVLKPQSSRLWYAEVFRWLDDYARGGPV